MPLDGITVGFAAMELNNELAGGRVDRITQPEKDTVVLLIRADGKNKKLLLCASPSFARAHITQSSYVNPVNAPVFCMLLRKNLGGAKLLQVSQYEGDRVLIFDFQCLNEMGDTVSRKLVLEIMGHHSNLTLVSDGMILDAARHVSFDMSRVRQALPGLKFVMPPLQDNRDPYACSAEEMHTLISCREENLGKAIRNALRGLSEKTARELCERVARGESELPASCFTFEQATRLFDLLHRLRLAHSPQAVKNSSGEYIDILPFEYLTVDPALQQPFSTLSEAMDRVYSGRDRQDRIRQKALSLRHIIRTALEREEKKLTLQREEEAFGQKAESWRIFGELLNAQLYLVPRGQDSAALPDLYSEEGGTILIPLDRTLTPAQNAQRYFKKYRKAKVAAQTAAAQISQTLRSIELLENAASDLEKSESEDDLADIRLLLTEEGYIRREKNVSRKKQPESKPLSFVSPSGHTVLVGKNSIQNERITASGKSGDIWLHAKDIPGSHVLLRREDRAVTWEDILFAAGLAAKYSSSHSGGVQVDYTDRKYVRKVPGAPRGFVTYTNQKGLYIP